MTDLDSALRKELNRGQVTTLAPTGGRTRDGGQNPALETATTSNGNSSTAPQRGNLWVFIFTATPRGACQRHRSTGTDSRLSVVGRKPKLRNPVQVYS